MCFEGSFLTTQSNEKLPLWAQPTFFAWSNIDVSMALASTLLMKFHPNIFHKGEKVIPTEWQKYSFFRLWKSVQGKWITVRIASVLYISLEGKYRTLFFAKSNYLVVCGKFTLLFIWNMELQGPPPARWSLNLILRRNKFDSKNLYLVFNWILQEPSLGKKDVT